jgi:hypothetical protein
MKKILKKTKQHHDSKVGCFINNLSFFVHPAIIKMQRPIPISSLQPSLLELELPELDREL